MDATPDLTDSRQTYIDMKSQMGGRQSHLNPKQRMSDDYGNIFYNVDDSAERNSSRFR